MIAYSLYSLESFLFPEAFKGDPDRLRIIRYIYDLHIYPSTAVIIYRAGEQTVLSFRSCDIHPFHVGQLQRMCSLISGIQSLHMPAAGTETAKVVKPDEVRPPLPAFHMSEKRCISSHPDNICVTLYSSHEGGFEQRGSEMVPLSSFAMASILSGKNCRSFTVIAVIPGTLTEEPFLRAIEMLVHEICTKSLHLRPEIIELLSLGIRSGRTYYEDFRICLPHSLDERLETLGILRSPLFVTDSDIFQSERLRMTHFSPQASPFGISTTICEFYEVQSILYITVEFIDRLMRIHCIVLELAGKTAAHHRKRLSSDFLGKKEIFVESQTI